MAPAAHFGSGAVLCETCMSVCRAYVCAYMISDYDLNGMMGYERCLETSAGLGPTSCFLWGYYDNTFSRWGSAHSPLLPWFCPGILASRCRPKARMH